MISDDKTQLNPDADDKEATAVVGEQSSRQDSTLPKDQTARDDDRTLAVQHTEIDDEQTRVSDTPPDQADPALDALVPGYLLKDRFKLGDKLGQGGMGAVFRATDQRKVETGHPDPSVAIKVITGDFAHDARAFVALQRETDKSQTLAHPNIITVYDFDRDNSIFFMTMESLTGSTLDDYIQLENKDKSEVLGYIHDLANAIAYAHKRNIVHSDLKPANI
ncbi:MAG TPA: serine/threonine protein kinase, partial [Spongiibacteraceae bacterium]|nr:serine/threonine protein kinase [Spongiibacteraceae bacterium]